MESEEIRATLRQADRAEAAPWTDYPPTPRWYPVAVGAWAALLTLAFTELGRDLRIPAVLALIAVEVGFLRWYVRYRGGVMPSGRAPREFRRAILGFVAGATAVVLAIFGLVGAVGGWVGAAGALLLVPVVIAWYERAYAEAARRARERLT